MNILLAPLLFAIWSSIFPIGKLLLSISPPVFLTASRMLLAAGLLLGYLAIFKPSSFKMNRPQWLSIGILGFMSIYLTNILEFWGMQHLSAAKTCFIYSLSPFFTALLSYIHFKEKMTPLKWLGMSVGFIGFFPVFLLQTGSEDLLKAFSFISWPEIAVIAAAFFGVYGWVLLRIVVKDHETSPVMANGMSMLIGGGLALVHSFFVDSWSPLPIAAGKGIPLLQGLLAATFLSNILCYNLYGHLLKRFTATMLSFVGLLSPIFASLTGWALLGETPSIWIFVSTGIVCLGLFIVYYEELKQGYIKKAAA